MRSRRISSTSRKPSVVTSATLAPLPSRIALVATVVPCISCEIAPTSSSPRAIAAPSAPAMPRA